MNSILNIKDFSAKSKPREINTYNSYNRILLVVVGAKTEYSYFNTLNDNVSRELTIKTLSISPDEMFHKTNMALEHESAQGNPLPDEVWFFFDKDEFDKFDNTISSIESKNSSDLLTKWKVAWSNRAFEIWYILHFCSDFNHSYEIDYAAECAQEKIIEDYKKTLTAVIQKHCEKENFKYEKTSLMYELLYQRDGNFDYSLLEKAIENAKAIYEKNVNNTNIPSEMRHTTTVYQFMESVIPYLSK